MEKILKSVSMLKNYDSIDELLDISTDITINHYPGYRSFIYDFLHPSFYGKKLSILDDIIVNNSLHSDNQYFDSCSIELK